MVPILLAVGCGLFGDDRPVVDTHWYDTSVPDTDTDTETGDTAPTDPATFEVTWSVSGVSVAITDGTGAYRFGMAETGGGTGGWYGEDCLEGQAGWVYCHVFPAQGGSLTTVADPADVVDGEKTLFDANQASKLTYAAWAENGACHTWGNQPSYYGPQGCVAVTP